jgi:DNA repair exonuclease SbcCD ATPase subunit
MITEINKEITDAEDNYNNAKSETDQAIEEYTEIERKIDDASNLKVLFQNLVTLTDDLVNHRKMLQCILREYSVQSLEDFLSVVGFSSIEDMIEQITKLQIEITHLKTSIQAYQNQIKKENEQYKAYQDQLSLSNKQMQDLVSRISELKCQMQECFAEISASSLDVLLSDFRCLTVDELIIRRKILESTFIDRKEDIDAIRVEISSLTEDIRNREANITRLLQREALMLKKENKVRHVRYLRGEIDGFISNYVVEGKMAGVLRQATNHYLTQLTEGRYTIDNISSTLRRGGGIESHGLEITLMDGIDNMLKSKDQLSGGDETALGLALRIAISKLMARIRPFKSSEIRPPIINSVIMDEPMASLDSNRRRILVNMLTQDKSFKQIFLVTHTDIEFGDYHSIMVSEGVDGKRQIDYRPFQL